MDLTRIRTNRGAVVSVHFGQQVTTNIWWNYGWYTITDDSVISILKDIKRYEQLANYEQVEYLVNHLREDYNPNNIGTPYRRDRASHSNLGRRARPAVTIVTNDGVEHQLILDEFSIEKLNGENLSYSDILQISAMKEQTFGVEVEMVGISRRHAAEKIAEFFGTTAYYDDNSGHYDAWVCKDRQGRLWQFERDGSLPQNSAEMVTPILNYSDIDTLQQVIRILRSAGAKSSARSNCGVHVHIGAQGMTAQQLKNLAIIMYNFEHTLWKAIDVSESRSQYCEKMSSNFINQLMTIELDDTVPLTSRSQAQRSEEFSKFADVWYRGNHVGAGGHYNSSRYHVTNFHSVFDHGTVEFRLFEFKEPDGIRENGLHAGELKAFIQMSMALMQLARVSGKLTGVTGRYTGRNLGEMNAWLDKLCMCGSEFETARQYYTKRLTD